MESGQSGKRLRIMFSNRLWYL